MNRFASKINNCLRLIVGLFISSWLSLLQASETESLTTIRSVAENFALIQLRDKGLEQLQAQASSLDSRLQLQRCSEPLQAFATSTQRSLSRTTVGVRCTGSKPWTLYVPVQISAQAPAVIALQPLARGEPLLTDRLTTRLVALDQLPANAISDVEQLQNMELSRPVNADDIITLSALQPRKIIVRGQEVAIIADGGGISVRASGVAMESGALGSLIQVRNASSDRSIEARVVDAGTVRVKN